MEEGIRAGERMMMVVCIGCSFINYGSQRWGTGVLGMNVCDGNGFNKRVFLACVFRRASVRMIKGDAPCEFDRYCYGNGFGRDGNGVMVFWEIWE